jgi:glycosyltransferase involved in cell wall biosynthesis
MPAPPTAALRAGLPLHICFDPQIFAQQDYGGVSRYFCETAIRLAAAPDTEVSVLAFGHVNAHVADVPRRIVVGRRLPMLPQPALRPLSRFNQLLARAWLGRRPADIVHETYYSGMRTAKPGVPTVVTVFDMIHEKFPDYAPRTRRIADEKRAAIQRADHLICISENTRRDLEQLYGIGRSRASVVRLGFAFKNASGLGDERSPISEPYILYVGKRGGYKDFASLLRAYAANASLMHRFALVCFGDAPFSAPEQALMTELGVTPGRVFHRGGNDALLATHYRHAALFVYPSRYEGFGMPPLEAMSQGCPVVCSNAASLPEVVGDAAEMFEAGNPEALRAAIESVLDSPHRAAVLRESGRRRAGEFSWETCARQTRQVYASLC